MCVMSSWAAVQQARTLRDWLRGCVCGQRSSGSTHEACCSCASRHGPVSVCPVRVGGELSGCSSRLLLLSSQVVPSPALAGWWGSRAACVPTRAE